MAFQQMDPELAMRAIEGYTNVLAPESTALEAFYRQFRCKRCGGPCQKEYVTGHAFSDQDTMVPRACLRCSSCRCLFDPHSDLLIERGDQNKALIPF
jgi:hypothetical protein